MPRRLVHPELRLQRQAEADAAIDSVSAMVRHVKGNRSASMRKFSTPRAISFVVSEAEKMSQAGDFQHAQPRHLVGLYLWCHAKVYGVSADEVVGDVWRGACSAAARLVRDDFQGSLGAAIEFVRWTWQREQYRRTKGASSGTPYLFRVGWRLQFMTPSLLTDYRVDLARKAAQ